MFIRAKKFLSELISKNLNLQLNEDVIDQDECQIQPQNESIGNDNSNVNDLSSHFLDFERAEHNENSEDSIKENVDVNFIGKVFPERNENILIDMIESDTGNEKSEESLMTDESIKDILMFYENKNFNADDLKLYDKEEIRTYLNKIDLFNEKCFTSLNHHDDEHDIFKKILIVSHSGFISELINCINMEKNIKPIVKHNTNNTGLYVIRIYCKNCGVESKCKLNAQCGVSNKKIDYDFIITNDVSHLDVLKDRTNTFFK